MPFPDRKDLDKAIDEYALAFADEESNQVCSLSKKYHEWTQEALKELNQLLDQLYRENKS